jgi:hypothetical protein
MDNLSSELIASNSGCYMEGYAMNHFMYADDVCLISPSPTGLQRLLRICEKYATTHDILYNLKKSVCMLIQSNKVKFIKMPSLTLNGKPLLYVESFRYLGCIISNTKSDDLDMERQRRALYVSVNRIKRKFWNCDYEVKKQLFLSYCGSLYCSHLWASSTKSSYSALRVAYNNSLRILFGYDKFCSASRMFVYNGIPNFEALIRKYVYSFMGRLHSSNNSLIVLLDNPLMLYSSVLGKRWREQLYAV